MTENKKRTAKKTKTLDHGTQLEQAAMAIAVEDREIEVKYIGGTQVLRVKQFIDLATRTAIIAQTEAMYFQGGNYDPYYGDLLLDFIVLQTYTGLAFGNDITVFEKFRGTEAYATVVETYPAQVLELREAVKRVVDSLLPRYSVAEDKLAFYRGCSALVASLAKAVSTLDGVLTATAASVKENGGFDLKEMMEALRTLGKKDELKIARAVLDFQEEKARRAVKAEPVEKSLPHI